MHHATMVITLQIAASASGLRPVRISLPLVDQLVVAMPDKYAPPENLPAARGVELRPLRAPSLRSMGTSGRAARGRRSSVSR